MNLVSIQKSLTDTKLVSRKKSFSLRSQVTERERVRKREVWEMKPSSFPPDSHNHICESGLGGHRHVGNVQVWMGCEPCRP